MRKTFVQCPDTGKFIEKAVLQAQNQSASVHVMETFKSPIDGSIISDPAGLRAHNKKHGVTDRRDYGGDFFERKGKERDDRLTNQDKASKKARIEALTRATTHVRT